MKIGTITPTLGTRPEFLNKSREYMDRQTRRPDHRIIVNYPQERFPHDITDRYRFGLEELKNRCDLVFFIEDDDYYSSEYLEKIVYWFERSGSPEIFGIGETFFYHPKFESVWYRKHPKKDSPCAFQMCIRTDVLDKIDWSLIGDTFIDAGLWKQLKGESVTFKRPLAIGIKHGHGVCGAGGHNEWYYTDMIKKHGSDRTSGEWAAKDPEWLRSNIGKDADWYKQ